MKTVFTKIRNVKTPQRAHATDAGMDFFIPEWSEEYEDLLKEKNENIVIEDKRIAIKPHCRILIPSGIKMKVPVDHMIIAQNKSGVASKKGLDVGACVIDESYVGEWHINLINTTSDKVYIDFGQKIVQFVCVPIKTPGLIEISNDLFSEINTKRGEDGFGSTDNK